MTDAAEILSHVTPSATPSDADLVAWQALSRDEQLRRLRNRLAHSACTSVSTATVSDVLGRARAAAKLRHG